MSYAKWRPFCLGLNVLMVTPQPRMAADPDYYIDDVCGIIRPC